MEADISNVSGAILLVKDVYGVGSNLIEEARANLSTG